MFLHEKSLYLFVHISYIMKKAAIIFITILSYISSNANSLEYGLHVKSYPLPNSEFTSMVLENGIPLKIKGKEFTLSFDLWVRKENVFGTVLRIITNNNENIDLMFSVSREDERIPILVTGDKVHFIPKQTKLESWLSVTLKLNPENGQISLKYDREYIRITHPRIKGVKDVRIAFGFCPFEGFELDDVASVNIKNIILKRDNKEIRHWKMAQHTGEICYDEISNVPAVGKNTLWIIDDRITWRKIYEQKFNTPPSVTFDSISDRFFFATDKKELYIFQPSTRKADILTVKDGEYASNYPNQLIFVPSERELISYNLNENIYSFFDFSSDTWRGREEPFAEHDYWNNTVTFNPVDSTLISFGGYGHYLYNNELLFSYPFHDNRKQTSITLSEISPRYSPASGIEGENLYIFGGRGSPSGRQELSPRNYYDLFSINLKNRKVNRLWSMDTSPINGDFVPGENMIYNKDDQSFYLFTTQRGGTLMKINTAQAAFEPMSLPIGIDFDAQYMYTNLFFSPGQKNFYSLILLSQVSGESTLEIYEIDYPSMSVKLVQQDNIANDKATLNKTFRYIVVFIIVGFVLFLVFHLYKKRLNQKQSLSEYGKSSNDGHDILKEIEMPASEDTPIQQFYKFSDKCICFLGRFRVIDKSGNDITASFTPTLKTLLIALILYTARDPKGISGKKLIRLFWHDKTEEAAKNNRNVYMSKLRSILEEIGDVKIINQNSFWRIQIEDNTQCDYLETVRLFNEKDNQNLEKLIELLLLGGLLPGVEIDWIDTFKNDFSNTAIDLLSQLLKNFTLTDTLKLKIADALFQYDYLNEEALQVKCFILYQQGKIGLAKTIYDSFCNEYESSLGINYQCSFMQVIEQKCKPEN